MLQRHAAAFATLAADNTAEDMAPYLAASFNSTQQLAELDDPSSIFFIAEIDGVAVGYARLHAGPASESIEGEKQIFQLGADQQTDVVMERSV